MTPVWRDLVEPGQGTLADEARARYLAEMPWPHSVIAGLFPDALVAEAAREALSADSTALFRTAGRNQVKEETNAPSGPACREILRLMATPQFVAFVSRLTGIPDLLADETYVWAGLHRTPPGGFAMIHRDFRRHPASKLYHRVNVLLYLNPEWPLEYGGNLELWPCDMRAVGKVIRPLANTTVIFETHDQTLHGLPDRLVCPPDVARVSLVTYYYTVAAPERQVPVRRPVVARRPQDGFLVGRRGPASVIGDFTPEGLEPFARRVQRVLKRTGHPEVGDSGRGR